MTKSNSLRSLKKRRRSVDKRGSVKKERNRFNKKIPEEHHSGSPEAGPEEAVVSNEPEKSQQDNKDFTPWWNSSTLTDFYSWCQSTVTEGVEAFKDTVFPTRPLRRELNEVTRQLHLMEEKMERMSHNLQNPSAMDNGLSFPTAPPPVPPPPPPIAPPPPVMSFKGRAGANKGDKPAETKRKAQQQQQRLAVTLSDIKNVQLKTVNNVKTKEQALKSSEGLLRAGLKRCHHTQRENQFHCSPKLLVTTRKKLKTTGIDRTPGGTPITTTSHDAPLKDIDIKQTINVHIIYNYTIFVITGNGY